MASSKPETVFIRSIHKKFKKGNSPYFEKMHNPFRGGTPDVFYSGDKSDLWIEYKYISRIPRSEKILPDLTSQQSRWLNDRFSEGRNVAVVLGTPTGGVIYRNQEWEVPLSNTEIVARIRDREWIAQWIMRKVGVSNADPEYVI